MGSVGTILFHVPLNHGTERIPYAHFVQSVKDRRHREMVDSTFAIVSEVGEAWLAKEGVSSA